MIFAAAIALVSCNENKTEQAPPAPSQTTSTPAAAPETVEPTVVPAAAPSASLATKTVNGTAISVVKASVTGKVLYVELLVKSDKESSLLVMDARDIHYVDDAQAKKHELLKDDAGRYQASPMQTPSGSKLQITTNSRKPEALMNLKFAAPPENSKTITLNIPDFGSFDAIPVSR